MGRRRIPSILLVEHVGQHLAADNRKTAFATAWHGNLDQAELAKARALKCERKIDMLMFYEPSRFTRDMADDARNSVLGLFP